MKLTDYCIHTETKIAGFCKEYVFLSNFYKVPITYEGIFYPSVENAYQALKFPIGERNKFSSLSSSDAKKMGRLAKLPDEWENKKLNLMKTLVSLKFEDVDLRRRLFDTGYKELIELNNWKDLFWGIDYKTGQGENHLGKILMDVRMRI